MCPQVYTQGPTSATSSLNRHKCPGSPDSVVVSQSASQTQKQLIADKLTVLCILDSRPFEMVAGQGFIQYTQAVIDVAQSCQNRIDAKTLISHPTTISRKTHGIKNECVKKLAEILKRLEEELVGMAFSADIWSDSSNQVIEFLKYVNPYGKDQKISIHDLWSHLRMRPTVCFLKEHVLKLILVPISNF